MNVFLGKEVSSEHRFKTVFALLLIFAFLLNFWKIHYGFPSPDETFYISMIQRFVLGDIPVIHEWNPAQFPTILFIPLYRMYILISGGSTEGIILYFRFLYILMVELGGWLIWSRTKQYGWGSIAAAAVYLFYTFGNIQTMHYDTLGLFSMVLMVLMLVFPFSNRKFSYLIAGLAFAAAVLCTPYLAIPYFLITVLILIQSTRKTPKARQHLFIWLWFTAGSIILAVIVIGYLLSKAGLSEYLRHFPLLFSSTDTTYSESGSFLYETAKTAYYGWLFSERSTIYLPIHLLFILLLGFRRRKIKALKNYEFPFLLISHVILILCYWKAGRDFSMLTFALLGILPVLFDRDFDNAGFWIWITGLIYAWMSDLTSDTLLGVLSSSCTVCAIGSVLMISSYLKRIEMPSVRKLSRTIFASLICIFAFMEIFNKVNYTYQDTSPLQMHGFMTRGPAEGIHTQKTYSDAYEVILSDIDDIGLQNTGDNVLLWSNRSWIYLYINAKSANYSTWFKPFETHFIDITPEYYEMHPEKVPDIVYMPKNEEIPYVMERYQFGNVEDLEKIVSRFDFSLNETLHSYWAKQN